MDIGWCIGAGGVGKEGGASYGGNSADIKSGQVFFYKNLFVRAVPTGWILLVSRNLKRWHLREKAVSVITRSCEDAECDHMVHLSIWLLLAILAAWQYLGPSIFRSTGPPSCSNPSRPSITSLHAPQSFGYLLGGR